MAHDVTLILGDGVGPELAEAARMCVDATGVKISWDPQEAGIDVMERTGTPLPEPLLASIRRTRCCLEGPHHHAGGQGFSQRQRATPPGIRAVRLRPPLQVSIRAFAPFSAACRSIWSSSARTPKTCMPASNSRPARPRPAS